MHAVLMGCVTGKLYIPRRYRAGVWHQLAGVGESMERGRSRRSDGGRLAASSGTCAHWQRRCMEVGRKDRCCGFGRTEGRKHVDRLCRTAVETSA